MGFQDCSGKETPVLARWKVNCDFNAHLVHVLGRRTKILLIYIIRNLTVNYIDSNVFIVILNPELWFEDNWGRYTFFKEKWRLRINLVCLPCFSYIVRNCVSIYTECKVKLNIIAERWSGLIISNIRSTFFVWNNWIEHRWKRSQFCLFMFTGDMTLVVNEMSILANKVMAFL